jgi:S-methylmethionine-dependent homocysteine/selenocysteine methylase
MRVAMATRLPQLDGGLFLTDGGLETVMIFHEGVDLPEFAAFPLLDDEEGIERLRRYYRRYADLAREQDLGFVLESPTWRASPRWAAALGISEAELDKLNRSAIVLLEEIRAEYADLPVVISGCVGPQDDGYRPAATLSADEAQAYHATQIGSFARTAADLVTAITMTYAAEAIGIARAATAAGLPVVISYTVETDGRLPSGQPLGDAIGECDEATGAAPAYYMVNCAHPTHFAGALESEPWIERIGGLRANASTRSHAELDAAEELDAGDPADLGARHAALSARLPRVTVLGGCCGTDHRHVAAIRDAWLAT